MIIRLNWLDKAEEKNKQTGNYTKKNSSRIWVDGDKDTESKKSNCSC